MSNLPFKLGTNLLGPWPGFVAGSTFPLPFPFRFVSPTSAAKPPTDPRSWTIFDPKLRIDAHSNETAHIVVATYLPTGQQSSCGKYGHQIQNRAAAIEALKMAVVGS